MTNILNCEGVPFQALPLALLAAVKRPGVYMFCRRKADGLRKILYIGQAEDLASRMQRHEKLQDARRLGMNEFHVHLQAKSARERVETETYLRRRIPTPLNEQLPTMQSLGLLSLCDDVEPSDWLSRTPARTMNTLGDLQTPLPANALAAPAPTANRLGAFMPAQESIGRLQPTMARRLAESLLPPLVPRQQEFSGLGAFAKPPAQTTADVQRNPMWPFE